jgi:hypothetical protein
MYIRCWDCRNIGIIIIIFINSSTSNPYIHSSFQSKQDSNTTTSSSKQQPTTQPIKMPTSHISTPLNGVDAAIVIAALHNHELMIKTLCPALVSYSYESGDKNSSATYSITDKKPIGQVSITPLLHLHP